MAARLVPVSGRLEYTAAARAPSRTADVRESIVWNARLMSIMPQMMSSRNGRISANSTIAEPCVLAMAALAERVMGRVIARRIPDPALEKQMGETGGYPCSHGEGHSIR